MNAATPDCPGRLLGIGLVDLNRPQRWAFRTVGSLSSSFVALGGDFSITARFWPRSETPKMSYKCCLPLPSRPDTPYQESNENTHHGSSGVPLPFPLRVDQGHKHEGDEEPHEAGQINVSHPTMNETQNWTYAQRSKEYGRL